MCVVSAVGDYFKDGLPGKYPWITPHIPEDSTQPARWPNWPPTATAVSKEEFDKLKADVEAPKQLLIAAKKFDEVTGQPDCELDAKVDLIKKIAAFVGVNVDDVFGKPSTKRKAKDGSNRKRRPSVRNKRTDSERKR